MYRIALALAVAILPAFALAQDKALVQREFAGRDSRFIEMPDAGTGGGFRALAPGQRLAFDARGVEIQLPAQGHAAAVSGSALRSGTQGGGTAALRYSFEGGAAVQPQGTDLSATVYHWLVGDRAQWQTGLKSYGGIRYAGVWPGVDAVFSGGSQGFKYQFEVAAGVDPARVVMRIEGADEVRLNASGGLEWRVGQQWLADKAPVAFQPSASGVRLPVPSAYRLEPLGAGAWRVGFTFQGLDATRPLVIDPAWVGYSGLVGGNAGDQVFAVTRDGNANTYACGATQSTNLPLSLNGARGGEDAFMVKFDRSGVPKIVTYVGGSADEVCNGIAVDDVGRIYLAGGTSSTNFPTAGVDGSNRLRRTKGADRDAFVMRLAATGASVDYSGFIGGDDDDQANGIALDASGRAYVTGFSYCAGAAPCSTTFPAFIGPRTTHGGGGMDAFVARVDAAGATLEYAGFIGGDGGADIGYAIAVSGSNAFVAGATDSLNGLGTLSPLRTSINDRALDASDAFVARVATSGASLDYLTLLTGAQPTASESGADRALAIAVDAVGSVLVAGETDSVNFPLNAVGSRVGAGPRSSSAGGMDGFWVRLDSTGASVVAATYLGGSGYDSAEGVATDGLADYVAGTVGTGSGFTAVAQNGVNTVAPGGQEGFMVKMDRAASPAFVYAGFLGTPAADGIRSLALSIVDDDTILSMGGFTTTSGTAGLTNPVSTGLASSSGSSNGLVLRIDPYGPPASVTVQSGSGQSTPIFQSFSSDLSVLVKDVDNQPVPYYTVSFTPPVSGASTTSIASVTTNAQGIATASGVQANGLAGGPYAVRAQAGSVYADIQLTNDKGAQATLSVQSSALSVGYHNTATLSVSGGSGTGGVSYAITSGTGQCSVTGNVLTAQALGSCTVTATKATDSNYLEATATLGITVVQATQTLSFANPGSMNFGANPTLSATATSGLTPAFSSSTPSVCTVTAGGALTLLSSGSCTILVDQAGDQNYLAAAQVSQTFTVNAVVPDAPTAVTATAGNAQATVGFSAPANTGGAAITAYTVTSSPDGRTCSPTGTPLPTTCTVTGLTNGQSYTFTVTATNSAGTSAASAPSSAVTPVTTAGAPTSVVAVAGDGQASVSFSAPADNGGASISSYSVVASPGPATASGAASPIVVTGLTNGQSYTFVVTAINSVGAGTASSPSAAVTPKAAQTLSFVNPGTQLFGTAPTLTATASSGLTPTFSSNSTGVCTITSGGALTFVTAGSCSIQVDQTGNAAFLAAPSVVQTFTVNPVVPGAPTSVVATAGNGQASVSFQAPANTGGVVISGYTVTSSPGNLTCSPAGTPLPTSCTVTGLSNGTAYTFTVRAANSVGSGPASGPSNSVVPATVPDAPTQVVATAGDTQVSVSWTAPAAAGGAVITGYTVTSSPEGKTCSPSGTPLPTRCVVTGLTNGQSYTFTVVARNSVGAGPASDPSNAVTPVPVVVGVCGAANGQPTAFLPKAGDLCVAGAASLVVGSGTTWSWSCAGANGGTTASCQAPGAPLPVGVGAGRVDVAGGSWVVDPALSAGFIPTSGHPASPATLPARVRFPLGLFGLQLTDGAFGGTATVTLTYASTLPAGARWWKYGPTAANNTPHWYVYPGAVVSGNTVVLTLTDGQLGDADLAINGRITDPGGLGVEEPEVPVAIPAVSTLGLVGLAALLVLAAGWRLRRRT